MGASNLGRGLGRGDWWLRSREWGWFGEERGLTSSLIPRRCGPSSHLPAIVAHLGGSPEPGPCAGAAFWLPGLETVPQEREVYQ